MGTGNGTLAHEASLALVAGKYISLSGTGGGAADSADIVPMIHLSLLKCTPLRPTQTYEYVRI